MDPNTEKRRAFEKAKEQLSSGAECNVRYAALEIRRCLEAVVYEKLWAYRRRIPADAARKWQPPQAFKALLVLEPDADQSFGFVVGPQDRPDQISQGPWTNLGTDVRPKAAWLTKTWNKLGSFLHATWPFEKLDGRSDEQRSNELREFLERTLLELDSFVRQDLTVTMGVEVSFACSVCGTEIKANASGIERAGEVTCLNCGSRFFAKKSGEDFIFHLDGFRAACPECQASITLPVNSLAEGFQFSCPSCAGKFVVNSPIWEFRKSDPSTT